MAVMNFDAIIPTYNRAPSLRRLLASLRAVECPPEVSFQVIVVDNGSTDETPDLLAREQARKAAFRLKATRESRRGKAAALNRGLAESRAQVVAILDDDVVVDSDWLTEHIRAHRETRYDVVQGRILAGRDVERGRSADPDKLHEYNIIIRDYGEQCREIRGFAGTNVSLKRQVLDRAGLFDCRLGPGAAGFSEDTEYSRRVRSAGFTIGYWPGAAAYHELDPRRYGRRYNRITEYRKGRSRAVYRRDSLVLKVLPNLLANCIRYGVYRVLGQRQRAYRTEGRIVKACGYLVGKLTPARSTRTSP